MNTDVSQSTPRSVLIKRLQLIQKRVIPTDTTDLSIVNKYHHVNIIRNKNHDVIGFLAWNEIGFFNRKAYISSFAVLPEHQNRGLGSKLLAFTIDQIRKIGLKEIEVNTWRSNANALRFYRNHGFRIKVVEGENVLLGCDVVLIDQKQKGKTL